MAIPNHRILTTIDSIARSTFMRSFVTASIATGPPPSSRPQPGSPRTTLPPRQRYYSQPGLPPHTWSRRPVQPLPAPGLEFGRADRLESEAVAGADREKTLCEVDDAQGGAADQVPAAGRVGRVDAGLPTGDRHRAGGYADAGRLAAGQSAQGGREVAGVWEPRQEADREDAVFRPAVVRDDFGFRQAEPASGLGQVVAIVEDGEAQQDARRAGVGGGRQGPEAGFQVVEVDPIGVGEEGDRLVGEHDIDDPRPGPRADRPGPTRRVILGGEPREEGAIAERVERDQCGRSSGRPGSAARHAPSTVATSPLASDSSTSWIRAMHHLN